MRDQSIGIMWDSSGSASMGERLLGCKQRKCNRWSMERVYKKSEAEWPGGWF